MDERRIKITGRRTVMATLAWGLFRALPAAAAAGKGAAPIDMTATMLKTAGGLALIIGLILVAVWFLRRFGGAGNYRGAGSIIRTLDTKMLGPRKYVTLLEIGSRTLALGVTEQSISLLAEMAEGEIPAREKATAAPGFADILKKFTPKGKD